MEKGQKIGGYIDLPTGKYRLPGKADTEIVVKASRKVFEFTGNALIDRGVGIEPGTKVRVAKLHGCPPPGTMGQYHVVEAESGELLGMVAYGSLKEEK